MLRQALSGQSARRLFELPLDMYGADAVEWWFNTIEIREIADVEHHLSA